MDHFEGDSFSELNMNVFLHNSVPQWQHEIKCEITAAAAYLALSLFVGPRCHSITAFFAAAAAVVMLSMCSVRPSARPSVGNFIFQAYSEKKEELFPLPFSPSNQRDFPKAAAAAQFGQHRTRRVKRERGAGYSDKDKENL